MSKSWLRRRAPLHARLTTRGLLMSKTLLRRAAPSGVIRAYVLVRTSLDRRRVISNGLAALTAAARALAAAAHGRSATLSSAARAVASAARA